MPRLNGAVLVLVVLSVCAFLLQVILENFAHLPISQLFGFVPADMAHGFFWQLFTYMFMHGGVFHLLFNMLILWSLGSELESSWGAKNFVAFFFVCGLGAALLYGVLSLLGIGVSANIPLIGSSGAIYGLLLAYGILFGDRVLYFFMLFPMKAKYFVMILGAVELVSSVSSGPGGIAHTAHLGGMITGFFYLFGMATWRRRSKAEYREEQALKERKKRVQKAGHLKLIPGQTPEDADDGPKHWH